MVVGTSTAPPRLVFTKGLISCSSRSAKSARLQRSRDSSRSVCRAWAATTARATAAPAQPEARAALREPAAVAREQAARAALLEAAVRQGEREQEEQQAQQAARVVMPVPVARQAQAARLVQAVAAARVAPVARRAQPVALAGLVERQAQRAARVAWLGRLAGRPARPAAALVPVALRAQAARKPLSRGRRTTVLGGWEIRTPRLVHRARARDS